MAQSQGCDKINSGHSHLKTQLEEDSLPCSYGVGGIQFPEGYWTEGLSSSLAVERRPPLVPCHVVYIGPLREGQLAASEKAGKRARGGKQDSHSLIYNLILEVIAMTSVALFVNSASQGLAHTYACTLTQIPAGRDHCGLI